MLYSLPQASNSRGQGKLSSSALTRAGAWRPNAPRGGTTEPCAGRLGQSSWRDCPTEGQAGYPWTCSSHQWESRGQLQTELAFNSLGDTVPIYCPTRSSRLTRGDIPQTERWHLLRSLLFCRQVCSFASSQKPHLLMQHNFKRKQSSLLPRECQELVPREKRRIL